MKRYKSIYEENTIKKLEIKFKKLDELGYKGYNKFRELGAIHTKWEALRDNILKSLSESDKELLTDEQKDMLSTRWGDVIA